MNAKHTTLSELLDAPLSLGDAIRHLGLTVFPLVGTSTGAEFISLDRALELDFWLEELPGGDVNNLVAVNPTEHHVLLLDGQEVLGARQHRVFDGTFLVAPGAKMTVAVCCIERGRWDATREQEAFEASTHFADPRVRAAQRSSRDVASDGTLRSDQRAVWGSIDGLMISTGTISSTASLHELQASRESDVAFPIHRFAPREDQLGVLVYSGDELVTAELVGRADVYRDLHEKLIRGFSLIASDESGGASPEQAREDLERLLAEPVSLEVDPADNQRIIQERIGPHRGQGLARGGSLLHWSVVAAA